MRRAMSSPVQVSREILELLNTSTAKEQSIVEKFRSRGRAQVQEFCDHGTKEECVRSGDTPQPCTKLHFRYVSVTCTRTPAWRSSAATNASFLQAHHQQAHGREPGRLLLPQHLFPHGHV